MTPTSTEEEIRRWVNDHKVAWELAPWKEIVEQRSTNVGFELRLFARHAAHEHPSPGCGLCMDLHERLGELALAAFPREHRPTKYEFEPFDASFHLRPESGWIPEVQLSVHIVHREGYLRPLDECETRCAEEIRTNLERLGVQPKAWSEMRTQRVPANEVAASAVGSPKEPPPKGETS